MNPQAGRRPYRRHGLATPDNLLTYKACYDVIRNPWTRVAPCWQDQVAFTRGVIDQIGRRPPSDQVGRYRLASRADLNYLLEGGEPPEFDANSFFEHCPPRTLDSLPEWVIAGHVFQPGYVEWRFEPFTRRPRRVSTTLPRKFEKSHWGHPDRTRQQAKRRQRDAERRSR